MITFHISESLNRLHTEEALQKYPDWVPPTPEELQVRRDAYEQTWSEVGEELMSHMEDLTGLSFEPHIECYVLSGTLRDHSRPLVLKSRYTRDEFIARMCHELSHRLFSGSEHAPLPYPDENQKVRNHIITFALVVCLLTPEQIVFERSVHTKDYLRAWEIVDRDGATEILNQFRSLE